MIEIACLRCYRKTVDGVVFTLSKNGKRRDVCDQCFASFGKLTAGNGSQPRYPNETIRIYEEGVFTVHVLAPAHALGSESSNIIRIMHPLY